MFVTRYSIDVSTLTQSINLVSPNNIDSYIVKITGYGNDDVEFINYHVQRPNNIINFYSSPLKEIEITIEYIFKFTVKLIISDDITYCEEKKIAVTLDDITMTKKSEKYNN